MLKSILAVIAGILFIIIVSTIVDQVLHAVSVYQPEGEPLTDALALLATAYRFVIGIAGAWLTARLAPQNPMKHVMILAGIGIILGLIGVLATWNKGLGPRWYAIALVVLAIPQCWLGGKSYESSQQR